MSGWGLLGLLPVMTLLGRGLAVAALVYGQRTPSCALGAALDILCWCAARWLTLRAGHAPSHSMLGGLGGSAAWQLGHPSVQRAACLCPPARRQAMPGHNMLGLEIREPIIERANRWAEHLDLQRTVLFLR